MLANCKNYTKQGQVFRLKRPISGIPSKTVLFIFRISKLHRAKNLRTSVSTLNYIELIVNLIILVKTSSSFDVPKKKTRTKQMKIQYWSSASQIG